MTIKQFNREQHGSGLIEFTFSILLVLVIIFGTIELASAVYTYTVLAEAANEGVRYALVNSANPTLVTDTQAKVTQYAALSIHDVSGMTVSVNYPDGDTTLPHRIRVTVSYPYVPYLEAFMPTKPTMSAYAESRFVH